MEKPEAKSFKPLTISVEKLPASMAQHARISEYATERARLLLGCYRTGDANDPDTYVAAIAATLARYSEAIITDVTHPVSGLPSKKSWLPTVKEVFDACEEHDERARHAIAREKRIKEQLAARAEEDRLKEQRPTLEQMKAKYGENWGLTPRGPKEDPAAAARANAAALERQQARVRAEYAEQGLTPPSPLALSITARRDMAQREPPKHEAAE